jgi:hypothetical protein
METQKNMKDMRLICSYIYKDSIQRVWDCFRLPEIFNLTIKNNADHITLIQGEHYGDVGTEVEFEWKSSFIVRFQVQEVLNTEFYKKIRFYTSKIYPLDFKYTCVFHFYWNTVEKNTLFQHELIFDDPNALKVIDFKHNKEEKLEMCRMIEKILVKRIEDLTQLINTNIQKVWDVVSDWKIFQNYVPLIAEQVDYEGGDPKTIGTRINIGNLSKNSKFSLKVLKCSTTEEKKEYFLELFQAEPMSPKQELHFTMVFVNDNITYLSFKHVFKEPIKFEFINSITREKKLILKQLKKRLEFEAGLISDLSTSN